MRGISFFCVLCVFIDLMDQATGRLSLHTESQQSGNRSWKPEELIPESYNKLKAPTNSSKPCNIRISLNITQILGVNEADEVSRRSLESDSADDWWVVLKQSYEMRCILTQAWLDDRIAYPASESNNRIFLTPDDVPNLWVPRTFIANSFSIMYAADAPVVSYEINRTKQIISHSRMSLKLGCDFDLSFFPHDTQFCDVVIESRK